MIQIKVILLRITGEIVRQVMMSKLKMTITTVYNLCDLDKFAENLDRVRFEAEVVGDFSKSTCYQVLHL